MKQLIESGCNELQPLFQIKLCHKNGLQVNWYFAISITLIIKGNKCISKEISWQAYHLSQVVTVAQIQHNVEFCNN